VRAAIGREKGLQEEVKAEGTLRAYTMRWEIRVLNKELPAL